MTTETDNGPLVWLVCTLAVLAALNFGWRWLLAEGLPLVYLWARDMLTDFMHWVREQVGAALRRGLRIPDKIENPSPTSEDAPLNPAYLENEQVSAEWGEPAPLREGLANQEEWDEAEVMGELVNQDELGQPAHPSPSLNQDELGHPEGDVDHALPSYEEWLTAGVMSGQRYSAMLKQLGWSYPEVSKSRFDRDLRAAKKVAAGA